MLLSRSGSLGEWQWLFTSKAMILAQVILDLPFVIGIAFNGCRIAARGIVFSVEKHRHNAMADPTDTSE